MTNEFIGYFKIPAKFCYRLNVRFDTDEVEPIIIAFGITDPNKVYEIVSLEKSFGIWEVADRFTGKAIELQGKGTVFEVTNAFVLKRKDLPGKVVATLPNGLKIVHMHFKRHMVKAIKRLSDSSSLDNNAIAAAKLTNAYIGRTRDSVLDAYPILTGGVTDNEGNYTPNLAYHTWSFEI